MATASFEARLKRIHEAQGEMEVVPEMPVRPTSADGAPRVMRRKVRRSPLRAKLVSFFAGLLLGTLGAALLLGLTVDISPWGPGTDLHAKVYWPAMGALALAPLFIVMAVFRASAKPRFALFSLGYLTGMVVPILV